MTARRKVERREARLGGGLRQDTIGIAALNPSYALDREKAAFGPFRTFLSLPAISAFRRQPEASGRVAGRPLLAIADIVHFGVIEPKVS